MADDADRAQAHTDRELASRLAAVVQAAKMPEGRPGECDLCGEYSGRLVKGACAPCRDKYGLD